MPEETPDRPKRKRAAKPSPLPLDPAPVELPVEAIAESIPNIESIPVIEPIIEPIIEQEIPVPKPKGTYNTAFYKAIGIPVCSFCGDKESLVCPEGKHDCPLLLANKPTLPPVPSSAIIEDAKQGDFGRS
jgi:hypothetical protein